MALTPQDALNPISNANSYLSLVDARALADQYAYTLPTDDAEAEKALIKAFRYAEGFEHQMCGTRATATQNTSWPRKDVVIRCESFPSDEFPQELLISQVIAAEKYGAGTDISGGVDDGKSIASEKVDVIEVSYFNNGKTGSEISIPEFDSTMQPLLCSTSNAFNFDVFRG